MILRAGPANGGGKKRSRFGERVFNRGCAFTNMVEPINIVKELLLLKLLTGSTFAGWKHH